MVKTTATLFPGRRFRKAVIFLNFILVNLLHNFFLLFVDFFICLFNIRFCHRFRRFKFWVDFFGLWRVTAFDKNFDVVIIPIEAANWATLGHDFSISKCGSHLLRLDNHLLLWRRVRIPVFLPSLLAPLVVKPMLARWLLVEKWCAVIVLLSLHSDLRQQSWCRWGVWPLTRWATPSFLPQL